MCQRRAYEFGALMTFHPGPLPVPLHSYFISVPSNSLQQLLLCCQAIRAVRYFTYDSASIPIRYRLARQKYVDNLAIPWIRRCYVLTYELLMEIEAGGWAPHRDFAFRL
jgi:hypothetical protein